MSELISLNIKSFSYDEDSLPVFQNFSFAIREGELLGVMGRNGCGKSTLLYLFSGELKGNEVELTTALGDEHIGFVFQDYRQSLFPWKTAIANICLPQKIKGIPEAQYMSKAHRLIQLFKVEFDLKKLPMKLSGGEQQKICIIRSLIESPKLFLMDEPCSAMDYGSRMIFLHNLRSELKSLRTAAVFTSHSAEDAFIFCDRLIILADDGQIAKEISDCQHSEKYYENLNEVHSYFLA